jgi:hypothetical protein
MDLETILNRFAEGLVAVDASTMHSSANQRTGEIYLPGVKTLREPIFVGELVSWWKEKYPRDFNPENGVRTEVPYTDVARAKCDLVFSSDGSSLDNPEWAIEVKHIALVGNNGKNNDYGVPKILSPYLKDRSLIHDIKRMQEHPIAKKQAVIGYCFEYSFDSCDLALAKHSTYEEYISNVRTVCKLNGAPGGKLSVLPMAEFADEIFTSKNLVKPLRVKEFKNAWRHPCGGNGQIFGWEIK